jgi:hypothetical protein
VESVVLIAGSPARDQASPLPLQPDIARASHQMGSELGHLGQQTCPKRRRLEAVLPRLQDEKKGNASGRGAHAAIELAVDMRDLIPPGSERPVIKA